MKTNPSIAVASLALSIMLWLVVYAQNVPGPSTVDAPVTLDGVDDSRIYVRKAPTNIRLMVHGPADRIQSMRDERVTVSVDLSRAEAGEHEYPVLVSPTWVREYLVEPRPTAKVDVEPMASKVVPVTMEGKGTLRDPSLRLSYKRVSPTSVTVRGPKSEVDQITAARTYLDLSQVDPIRPEPQEADIVPLSKEGGRPQHVRSTPAVALIYYDVAAVPTDKLAQIVPTLAVSYADGILSDGYRLSPEVVTLSGKPLVLANVSKVPTERIEVSELKATRKFRVKVIAPEGTKVVGSPYVEVTVRVRKADSPTPSRPAGDRP